MIADNTFLKSNFHSRNSIANCLFHCFTAVFVQLCFAKFAVPPMPAGIVVYESVSGVLSARN